LTEIACRYAPIAVFRCTPSLECELHDGQLADLIECDSSDLYGTGWIKYSHPADKDTHRRIKADIAEGRGGRYRARSISTSGDLLLLTIVTFALLGGAVRGSVQLNRILPGRTHVQITRPVAAPMIKEL
jgi:hypothetical protein